MTGTATTPAHFVQLRDNLTEVRRLTKIHAELTGDNPGRRAEVDILNKSGIVLAVACWEAFVEDLAASSFDFLLTNATTPQTFPAKVLVLASKPLRADPDERRVWELAGSGWQTVLNTHRTRILAEYLDGFHTPRAAKVDTLFEQLVGYAGLSKQWSWHKNPATTVVNRLEALVTLRGEIAHRVSVGRYVQKAELTAALSLVQSLAAVSSNRLRGYLLKQTTVEPWPESTFGSAK